MKRKDFLRSVGLAGAALGIARPAGLIAAPSGPDDTCTLIPSETAGPFPLDLTENTYYFRQDVREDRAGVQHNVKLRIVGVNNCLPMANVRVNIWHCDKDGNYSGYQNFVGQTFLRGYQITDANGEVEFVTIFPGWYNGRICHIHFQVAVSSAYSAISQMTFDIPTKNAIYAANPSLYTKGADPLGFNQDNIFSDGYTVQLATLTPNATTGGYDSMIEVAVQGTGVSGLGHTEKENAKRFGWAQNYPNPFDTQTTIPFTLKQSADVRFDIRDLQGRLVKSMELGELPAGKHSTLFERGQLPRGNYACQIKVTTPDGAYTDSMLMTGIQ